MPGDLVDEGKPLLFIREEVATRPPRRGRRLIAEKRRTAELKGRRQKKRRKKRGAEWIAGDEEVEDESSGEAEDGDSSDLFLIHNTVRGYVSAINELWRLQTSKGLQNSPLPVMVALYALKTSGVRREHHRLERSLLIVVKLQYRMAIPLHTSQTSTTRSGASSWVARGPLSKPLGRKLFSFSAIPCSCAQVTGSRWTCLTSLPSICRGKALMAPAGRSLQSWTEVRTFAEPVVPEAKTSQETRISMAEVSMEPPFATRITSPVSLAALHATSSGDGICQESHSHLFAPIKIDTKQRS